jgi:Glycosyltransferases involved in cell wall biogenesis
MPRDRRAREVIVVDNGSTDRTAERAREAGARVITAPRGYGRACAAGARAVSVPQSRDDIVVFSMATAATFQRSYRSSSSRSQEDARFRDRLAHARAARNRQHEFPADFIGANCRMDMQLLYGVRYTDMCPFRAIRRDALAKLDMREETYGWNLEMQMKAARAGCASSKSR